MFWNNHDTTALNNSVQQDGVLFSFFSFFHNIKITQGSLLEKKMDITKYFKKSNDKLDGHALNSFVSCSSTSSVLLAAKEMNSVQDEQDHKKKRQVLTMKVKHGNPEARRWASKKYPDYTLKEEAVRNWKMKYQKAFESTERGNFFALPCQWRPSNLSCTT